MMKDRFRMCLESSEDVLLCELAELTPIAHIGVHAICALVVRDRIDVSVTPTARLDGLIFVVGRLNLEALEKCRRSTHACRMKFDGTHNGGIQADRATFCATLLHTDTVFDLCRIGLLKELAG
jgi:hypothetical protein